MPLGHRTTIVFALPFIILCLFCQTLLAQERQAIEGEYILMLENGERPSTVIEQTPAKSKDVTKRLLSERLNIWLIAFQKATSFSNNMLASFRRMAEVEIAQRNHNVSQRDTLPNDPLFPQKWSLDNDGQAGGVNGADISAPKAWEKATGGVTASGDTVVVAVIDGGFDLQHEDLEFWKNEKEVPGNGIDDDNNGYIDDHDGWNAYNQDGSLPSGNHGTHVTGIVGAKGNNNTGITGVNWNVEIMPIAGSSSDEATVLESYGYALEMRALYEETDGQEGAFIVATNSSFGVDFADPANYPLWCAFYDSMGAYGILNAAATINSNENVDNVGDVPTGCSSPWMVSVTNSNRQDQLNSSAGYGIASIDLAAPGTDINSTVPGNQYSDLSGTSMATPHVTGAIALMYSVDCPELMNAYNNAPASVALTVKDILLATTDTPSTLKGKTVSDGRLNVNKAIDSLKSMFCVNCVSASFQKVPPTCPNDSNGVIEVSIPDSTSQYQIDWSNGNSGRFTFDLTGGSYKLTISDTTGCSETHFLTLQEPDVMASNFQKQDASNQQTNDGYATVSVQGGTSPYSFQWSNGQNGKKADNLSPGNYQLTVSDANGCTHTDSITIKGRETSINGAKQQVAPGLYPNPANEELTVRLPAFKGVAKVTIIDATGQTVDAGQFRNCYKDGSSAVCTKALDISQLQSGLYLLKAQNENGELISDKFLVR